MLQVRQQLADEGENHASLSLAAGVDRYNRGSGWYLR